MEDANPVYFFTNKQEVLCSTVCGANIVLECLDKMMYATHSQRKVARNGVTNAPTTDGTRFVRLSPGWTIVHSKRGRHRATFSVVTIVVMTNPMLETMASEREGGKKCSLIGEKFCLSALS